MKNKIIKVKEIVTYGGHSITANGAVNLTLKASYSELPNTIQLIQMLNNDIIIKVRLPGEKPMKIGSFRIKQINVHDDGESTLKFNGLTDWVETDNISKLPLHDSDINEFIILCESEIEFEEEQSEEQFEEDTENKDQIKGQIKMKLGGKW